MLSDVFEWPIAVDSWETNYGRAPFFPPVSCGMMSLMVFISFSLLFYFLCLISSGKTWRLEDVIAKLNEKYGTLLLVNFFVGTDDRDSTSHIIHVGVGM